MDASAAQALRLFIAVRCPASAELRRVLDRLAACGPGVKPVGAGDLHLTLRFLGDTPADRVPALGAAISRAVQAAAVGPFDVRWIGLGRFPVEPRKPTRVIHTPPADPGPFQQLAAGISDALAALDPPVPPEPRPFHAHLTLARLKPARGARRGRRHANADATTAERIEALLREHETSDLGGCRVETVQLIASELTPTGPIHRIAHEAPL